MSDEATTRERFISALTAAGYDGLTEAQEVEKTRAMPNGDFLALIYDSNEEEWMVCRFYIGRDGKPGDWGGAPYFISDLKDDAVDFMGEVAA